jgi:hypothetical protein
MEAMAPLPPLFMRSVITLMRVTPALLEPILELLKRLVPKQVCVCVGGWCGRLVCVCVCVCVCVLARPQA